MKIILKKDVKKLGSEGDILEVSEGYGRNYLIPKGLAVEASNKNISVQKDKNKSKMKKYEKQLKKAKDEAETIKDKKISIKTKAGEKGRLFGSVTNKDVAEAIEKQLGLKVDKRKIDLSEPIKDLGEHKLVIKLHPEVQTEFNVIVEEK